MTIPRFLHAIADDAAIFPPGNAPLDQAVTAHRDHRSEEYADLVGPFLVSDVRLPDLARLVESSTPQPAPLRVHVVVTGGAGAIEPAVTWARRAVGLELCGLEFALRDEDDLAHNARRLVSVLDSLEDAGALEEVTAFAEVPRVRGTGLTSGWLGALDELAAREIPVKLRTGGTEAAMFPSAEELSSVIEAVLDRELAFKCTAGLHHAVRHRDPVTGSEHHGFLNVLLATRAVLDGEDAVAVLEEQDPLAVATAVSGSTSGDVDSMTRTRRWFRSFGTCAVLEAHDDLVDLGLVEEPA